MREKSHMGNVLFLHGPVTLVPKHVSTECRFLFIKIICVRFIGAKHKQLDFHYFSQFFFQRFEIAKRYE